MISSVRFTRKYGYISEKIDKPGKPDAPHFWFRDSEEKKREAEENYQKELAEYEKEYAYWKEHKNDYKRPQLAKNLLDRTFRFCDDKINVIFGPNACGKTTLLKAIAGTAFIKDGYSSILEPMDYKGLSYFREEKSLTFEESLIKTRTQWMQNDAKVEWD